MSTEKKFKDTADKYDDEIDLEKIFFSVINILKRRFYFIVFFGSIGLLFGLAYYFLKAPVYQSTMSVSSGILTGKNSSNMINTLQLLIEEGSYEKLSERLRISPQQAQKLAGITVTSIGLTEAEEELENVNTFRVQVHVTDNTILDTLEVSLIDYLEDNRFIKRRTDLRRENLKLLISRLKVEMQDLDSLKNKVNNTLNTELEGSNVIIMDPVNVYREAIGLYQKELDLQTELALIDNIQIIEGFTEFNKPINPRVRHIAYGLLAGIFVGLLFIIFVEIFQHSKKYESSSQLV